MFFVLSGTGAGRRVTGDLTTCDALCRVGDSIWFGGRTATGFAGVQPYQGTTWESGAISLDCKGVVTAMVLLREAGELWCLVGSANQDSTTIAAVGMVGRRIRHQAFPMRIFSVIPVGAEKVLLFSSSKVVLADVATMRVLSTISPEPVRVPVVVTPGVVFGVGKSGPCLMEMSSGLVTPMDKGKQTDPTKVRENTTAVWAISPSLLFCLLLAPPPPPPPPPRSE